MSLLSMKNDKKSNNSDILWAVLSGIYIAALLWLTIFSRLGSNTRAFYPLFHSYSELFKGNKEFFVLGVANIALFVPLGFLVDNLTDLNRQCKTCIGFGVSLLIESCQWIFKLGEFECDDLLHNTLGAIIGSYVYIFLYRTLSRNTRGRYNKKRFCLVLLITAVLFECVPFTYKYVKHLIMVERVSYFDLEDGTKNLLVLNGDSGYVGDSDVYVEFLKDGSISISGSSDVIAWKRIGEIALGAGDYFFSINTESEKNYNLEFVVLKYDSKNKKYSRLISDNTSDKCNIFYLSDKEDVFAYIGVKECENVDLLATLALYEVD